MAEGPADGQACHPRPASAQNRRPGAAQTACPPTGTCRQIGGDARQVKVVDRSLSVRHGRRPRGGLPADSGLSVDDELGVADSALGEVVADEPQRAAIYASSVPAWALSDDLR